MRHCGLASRGLRRDPKRVVNRAVKVVVRVVVKVVAKDAVVSVVEIEAGGVDVVAAMKVVMHRRRLRTVRRRVGWIRRRLCFRR